MVGNNFRHDNEIQHMINKIFGIGLQRTGSTSLAVALLNSGLKVCHFVTSNNCYEMADFLNDAPIFLDYKKLDIKYPNSKFIYTTRDADKWMISFKKRVLEEILYPAKKLHPNNDRMMSEIFNTYTPSDVQLKKGFLNHKQNILEYFEGRDDLLVLDMDGISNEEKVNTISQFLNIKENITFPNITDARGWGHIVNANKII